MKNDWLWDKKITLSKSKAILRNPNDRHFLSLASSLFLRKNNPKEIFGDYLRPVDFFNNWLRIKRQMRRNAWGNPRIEYWQAVYENLKEKYKEKGISPVKEMAVIRLQDEFCKSVADKIRIARQQKGLTQSALARKLKVSQQMISRIEQGRENVSLLTLKNIVEKLGAELHLDIT